MKTGRADKLVEKSFRVVFCARLNKIFAFFFSSAKRLLKNFKHSDYEIKKYNPFKHSTPVQMLITWVY